jgi:hypothetical protein
MPALQQSRHKSRDTAAARVPLLVRMGCLLVVLGGLWLPRDAEARVDTARAAVRPVIETEVLILRGLFNVFSLGMDDLASRLQRGPIRSSVHNHLSWSAIGQDIIARRRAGAAPTRLVLIGHSLGGNDVISLARMLGQAGIGVDLVIPVDPTAPDPAPPNVRHLVNFYQSSNGFGAAVRPGASFRGVLVNADLATNRRDLNSAAVGHASIDKSPAVQREIIALVHALHAGRPSGLQHRAGHGFAAGR